MKTLYIGDIHGRINILRYVDETFKNHRKVFIGDYVDAFDRTRAEQMECLLKIFEMVDKGDTIALMGNHDLGYLFPREMQCTGYSRNFHDRLAWHLVLPKMHKYLQYYMWDAKNNILVTHAGLTNYIWKEWNVTPENLEDKFFEWIRDQYFVKPLYWLGKYRGGHDIVGGPLWCDWNAEFTPVEGITQIFGHTTLHNEERHDKKEGIRKLGQNYNIDCLANRNEFLEFDDETKQFNTILVDKEIKL